MIRTSVIALAVLVSVSSAGASDQKSSETAVSWTGWFSDKECAAARIQRGDISPNGTACVKKCLEDGAAPAFISEQAKALYVVKDYASVLDDVGYRVELTGVVDEKAKAISVRSVKRLSAVVQMCARPVKDRR